MTNSTADRTLTEDPVTRLRARFDSNAGWSRSHTEALFNEITKLKGLIGRLVDELVTVEYEGDPPKRVTDMIEEAEEAR